MHVIEMHHGMEFNRTNLHCECHNCWLPCASGIPFLSRLGNILLSLTHSLQWHHNERGGVSNHRRLDFCSTVCWGTEERKYQSSALLKKISKLRVTGLCEGNLPLTAYTANASIWWRHYVPDLVHKYVRNTQIYTKIYRPPNNGRILCLCYCPSGKQPLISPLCAWQYVWYLWDKGDFRRILENSLFINLLLCVFL